MSRATRKRLASLSFGEKLQILEKLRERSLAFAAARGKLKGPRPRAGKSKP